MHGFTASDKVSHKQALDPKLEIVIKNAARAERRSSFRSAEMIYITAGLTVNDGPMMENGNYSRL